MNENYDDDDSIQYRATHRQHAALGTEYGYRKAKPKPMVKVTLEYCISKILPYNLLHVQINRKGFSVQKGGFATLSEARQWRDEQLALAPPSKRGEGNTKYDFSGVDWSKSNQEIAALLGCTVPCVYSNRIKLGK